MVVGGEGMLEGQLTLLNGMLHCWTAADGMCGSLQPTSRCIRVLNTAAAAEGWSEED